MVSPKYYLSIEIIYRISYLKIKGSKKSQGSVYFGIDNESWYLNCTLINCIWDLFSYFIKHHYRDFNLVINSLHWWFETLKLYPTHSKILTATQKHRLKWPKIFFQNIFQNCFEDFYGKIWSRFRPLFDRKLKIFRI